VTLDFPKAAGWNSWKTVTVVRHPAERLYSQWCHFMRDEWPGIADTFEAYVEEPVCNCMACFCARKPMHHNNPMANFYAGVGGNDRYIMSEAKRVLEQTRIYDMHDILLLVDDLARNLNIPKATYRPLQVSGAGSKVTPKDWALVNKKHPQDVELYDWCMERIVF
jgi:hypothetical protein